MLKETSTSLVMLTHPPITNPASNGAQPELNVQGLLYGMEGARLNGTPVAEGYIITMLL